MSATFEDNGSRPISSLPIMGLSERLPKERWRRLGILNVSVICSSGVLLLIALISAIAKRPASTITEARILFRGECSTSDGLDLFLQLIINIFSTCILASSNFFMQVASSPTREEIDHAHQSLHSLEIGVTSFKNLGALSWFKIIAWAGLFLSSIPIHLFFNSAIFSTDYEGSDWHLTIASSDFVNQTIDYFVPGASLAPAGSSCPASPNGTDLGCSYSDFYIDAGSSAGGILIHSGSLGYGRNDSSMANLGITKAAQNSSSWGLLTPSECFDQYRFCKPRQKYRDLVIVVHEIPGWVRSEVFNFSGSAANNLSQFWNAQIPPNDFNSLWYSTPCRAWRYGNSWEVRLPKICSSSQPGYGLSSSLSPPTGCSGALGEPSGLDWINTTKLQDTWKIPFRPPPHVDPSLLWIQCRFQRISREELYGGTKSRIRLQTRNCATTALHSHWLRFCEGLHMHYSSFKTHSRIIGHSGGCDFIFHLAA